jgi:hypothetical protein
MPYLTVLFHPSTPLCPKPSLKNIAVSVHFCQIKIGHLWLWGKLKNRLAAGSTSKAVHPRLYFLKKTTPFFSL